MHHSRQDIGKQTGSTLPLPMRTEFRVPGLLKKAAEKFAAVLYTQFLIHMCAVRFHRIFADDQGGGNLPIALAAQAELAQAVGMPVDEVEELMRLTEQPTSLDVPIDIDRGLLLSDTLEDPGIESPEESTSEHVLSDEVYDALFQLTPRERSAVILRFGIGDGQNRTLLEVGKQLGISRERARQLIEIALEKLRAVSSIQMLLGSA